MLSSEVTFYDWMYIVFMFMSMLCMYAGYRWGHEAGYAEGCRARRKAERQVRRMLR